MEKNVEKLSKRGESLPDLQNKTDNLVVSDMCPLLHLFISSYFGNALQAASSEDHQEVVKLLLDEGADVNAQGGEYGNALQAASYRGDQEIVKLLLDKGADVNTQGGEYGNALQAASSRGHQEIVELL